VEMIKIEMNSWERDKSTTEPDEKSDVPKDT
jgi:hypothetical protein